MPSHLTAYVFRQILRNRPLSHAHCARNLLLAQSSRDAAQPRHVNLQQRQIFGLGGKNERQAQPLRIDPGVKQLAQLEEFLRMKSRPAANDTVLKALNELFAHKLKRRLALLDTDIHLALVALRHLLSQTNQLEDLSSRTLIYALQCLESRKSAAGRVDERLELAQILFEILSKRQEEHQVDTQGMPLHTEALALYVGILCSCQQAKTARDILTSAVERDASTFTEPHFWQPLLQAFVSQNLEEEIEATLKVMEKNGVPLNTDLQLTILSSYAQQRNFAAASAWHGILRKQYPSETRQADAVFLDLCIDQGKIEAGKAPFQRLLDHEPDKPTWDLILRWAAATGKGVDEVERMMDVMVRRNTTANIPDRPDIETINGLIKLANTANDPYRAERVISLAKKRGIHLNGNTYALQMEYRLGVEDVQGAYSAYQNMRLQEVVGDIDLPQINSLIQRLCAAENLDMEAISDCIGSLNGKKAELEPATISALCKLHLNRDEVQDLIDLLHTHAFRLESKQRHSITEIFKNFIVDESVSGSRAWDAYCIMRGIFTEMSNETRTQIMLSFFKRGRSEHAIHVFGNMRQAQVMSKRPSSEAYALCFQGLAHAGDQDSFHLVYNMLKLDTEVEPDTYLRNALMLAMVRVGLARRALEIWEDIVYSREGPTYNSITLVLYAIEKTAMKADPDEEVWTKLQTFGVEPTRENFQAYLGALCGQLRTGDAIARVENLSRAKPPPVDSMLIGILYNSSDEQHRPEVEQWAREKHPAVWSELEAIGRDERGSFKTKRTFKP